MVLKKKIKVAIMTEGGSNPTGTFYGANSLAEGLQKLGCDVYLVTSEKIPNLKVKQLVMKWPFINIPWVGRISWFFSVYLRLPKYKFDVVHSYGYGMINLLPIDRYKKTLKITTIADVMGDNKNFTKGNISMAILAKVLQPPHIRFNDLIITCAEDTKPKIAKLKKVELKRIKVIPQILSKDFIKITDKKILSKIRQKYKLPKEYLFHTGNLKPNKNIVTIIKSFKILSKKFPSLYLIFSGKLDSKNRSWYQNEVYKELTSADKNTRERIRFLNYVPYTDLKAIYTLSTVFVMPSLEEGFGVPLLEAMSCEVPIVTSNISCMPEVVDDAALLANPYNPNELAKNIEKIITNKKIRTELITRGKKRFKFFNQEKIARLTYKYYSEYLNIKLKNISQ
jgi:glycosyltransferase involved in cell wall biosynthesis